VTSADAEDNGACKALSDVCRAFADGSGFIDKRKVIKRKRFAAPPVLQLPAQAIELRR